MDLRTKKIYCGNCKTLVKSHEQRSEDVTIMLCGRCGATIYSWDGVSWKYVGG